MEGNESTILQSGTGVLSINAMSGQTLARSGSQKEKNDHDFHECRLMGWGVVFFFCTIILDLQPAISTASSRIKDLMYICGGGN